MLKFTEAFFWSLSSIFCQILSKGFDESKAGAVAEVPHVGRISPKVSGYDALCGKPIIIWETQEPQGV